MCKLDYRFCLTLCKLSVGTEGVYGEAEEQIYLLTLARRLLSHSSRLSTDLNGLLLSSFERIYYQEIAADELGSPNVNNSGSENRRTVTR